MLAFSLARLPAHPGSKEKKKRLLQLKVANAGELDVWQKTQKCKVNRESLCNDLTSRAVERQVSAVAPQPALVQQPALLCLLVHGQILDVTEQANSTTSRKCVPCTVSLSLLLLLFYCVQ